MALIVPVLLYIVFDLSVNTYPSFSIGAWFFMWKKIWIFFVFYATGKACFLAENEEKKKKGDLVYIPQIFGTQLKETVFLIFIISGGLITGKKSNQKMSQKTMHL